MHWFLEEVQEMDAKRLHLKKKALCFPEIYTETKSKVIYASTMVRFKDKLSGLWFKTHLVDCISATEKIGMPELIQRIFIQGYKIRHLFKPDLICSEIDTCQLSESERLKELNNHH